MSNAAPQPPETLDYATPAVRLPQTRFGIAAIAVLTADISWCYFFEWPFGYPKQFLVGFAAWLLGGTLALAASRARGRDRTFATVAGILFAIDFFLLPALLPIY